MSALGAMMAGGNPNAERGREKDDFYPTPIEVTEALCRRYSMTSRNVWEPCAGNGAMSDVLRTHGARVIETDIAPRREGMVARDFLQADVDLKFDHPHQGISVITNPPFNLAEKIIRHAWLELQTPFLALVLKSTLWHAMSRQKLWNDCRPAAVHPLTWRPDFLNLGAPTMEVMWCVWKRQLTREVRPVIYEPMRKPT